VNWDIIDDDTYWCTMTEVAVDVARRLVVFADIVSEFSTT
jgi:hypothetical protein